MRRAEASGTAMDLGGWLRSLGLERYETAFRENDINETGPLESHAGGPEGNRRWSRWSSADPPRSHRRSAGRYGRQGTLRSRCGHVHVPSVSPEDRAERRQVTVMFSDLVGSTALSARMDPEDLREVISAYQKCVAETVHRFGGFVAKFMGDGVLVYFGYPQARTTPSGRCGRVWRRSLR